MTHIKRQLWFFNELGWLLSRILRQILPLRESPLQRFLEGMESSHDCMKRLETGHLLLGYHLSSYWFTDTQGWEWKFLNPRILGWFWLKMVPLPCRMLILALPGPKSAFCRVRNWRCSIAIRVVVATKMKNCADFRSFWPKSAENSSILSLSHRLWFRWRSNISGSSPCRMLILALEGPKSALCRVEGPF